VPRKPVVLRSIRNILIELNADGVPVLSGVAVFYNPNNVRMKLKEVKVEVFVDGEKSAQADQKLNSSVPAHAEFSVPLKIHLTLKKKGLLDTFMSLLGGKKYEIHYVGYIRIRVHGVTVKVPVDFKDEIKLKI
jgi:LEA14-like dessication related protein